MNRQIILTEDGSHTIFVPELGDHYHSVHGAIGESMHIFIGHGLNRTEKDPVAILEIGFGTGLNAWLTLLTAGNTHRKVTYETWEAYPLGMEEVLQLNYPGVTGTGSQEFLALHEAPWGIPVQLNPGFSITKVHNDILQFRSDTTFDLVYFDAFGPAFQPELWETAIFRSIFRNMNPDGLLVTYSAKGQVKRNLREAGFSVTSAPGPPGKREITVAQKQNP